MNGAGHLALPPIHFRGMVLGPSGFAAQGREWLTLLEAKGFEPSLHGARFGDLDGGESAAERELISRCALRTPKPGRITVQHVLPPHFAPDGGAVADVVITVFETLGLPVGWGAHLDRAAAIVVPAPAIARAFVRGGLSPERMHAIAPPVATEAFAPGVTPWPGLPPRRPGVTRLLAVLDWSLRKGIDVLLPAFGRAFTADVAELILKVTPRSGLDRRALAADCQAVVQQHCRRSAPAVHVLDPLLTASDMPGLYAGCDALVLPSRGEGWGRPVHEAMLVGLPVVATRAGALATLLPDASLGYPVATSIAPVSAAAAAENPVFEGQQWWEPDPEDLVRQLQAVVRDPVEAARRGQRGREHILQLCEPGAIVAGFGRVLDSVLRGGCVGNR